MRMTRAELCGESSRRVAPRALRSADGGINAKTLAPSAARQRRGAKKGALRKQANRSGAAEIEKYRVKSAQTSILNCCRGPFAEGAGITSAIQGRHERIGPGYNGSLIGQFCR